ncbi:complement factor H-like [Tachysurus fulvidraco]|uniref:complement factor H-like n=1 Tax=Tachysurus fulvidraco TaxID=1234273 RepID=UPI001FF07995|nr:complement factor H-like [Tachysurus fulvidraco]
MTVRDATCIAPHVANAKPEKKLESSYAGGHTVRFVCDGNYEFEETSYAVCDHGTWWLPVCKEKITCRKPQVQYTEPEELKVSYDIGETIQFRCRPSYKFEGSDIAECVDGSWRLPVCRRRGELRCNQPRVQNGRLAVGSAWSYVTGSSVKFVCDDGYEFEGTHYAQCNNGQSKLPVCKQKTWCIPPNVPNAQTTGELDPSYPPGSRLWFKCKSRLRV